MTIGNVSFGRVVAVTGSYKKAGKLQNRMKQQLKQEKVIAYDVTDKYRYASTGGVLANSANKGECSLVYVTGKDVKKDEEHLHMNSIDQKSIDATLLGYCRRLQNDTSTLRTIKDSFKQGNKPETELKL